MLLNLNHFQRLARRALTGLSPTAAAQKLDRSSACAGLPGWINHCVSDAEQSRVIRLLQRPHIPCTVHWPLAAATCHARSVCSCHKPCTQLRADLLQLAGLHQTYKHKHTPAGVTHSIAMAHTAGPAGWLALIQPKYSRPETKNIC